MMHVIEAVLLSDTTIKKNEWIIRFYNIEKHNWGKITTIKYKTTEENQYDSKYLKIIVQAMKHNKFRDTIWKHKGGRHSKSRNS
jgi:rhamnogalacturonyl hydrolase YesR